MSNRPGQRNFRGNAAQASLALSRRSSARALSPSPRSVQYPARTETPERTWRTPSATLRSRVFFDEAEAQRRALGPKLPHHRRPLTVDEALAGIVLWLVLGACAFYCGWRWL